MKLEIIYCNGMMVFLVYAGKGNQPIKVAEISSKYVHAKNSNHLLENWYFLHFGDFLWESFGFIEHESQLASHAIRVGYAATTDSQPTSTIFYMPQIGCEPQTRIILVKSAHCTNFWKATTSRGEHMMNGVAHIFLPGVQETRWMLPW